MKKFHLLHKSLNIVKTFDLETPFLASLCRRLIVSVLHASTNGNGGKSYLHLLCYSHIKQNLLL